MGAGSVLVDKCHRCRKRKVKCGGERPSCFRCIRSNLACPGYLRELEVRFASQGPSATSTQLQAQDSGAERKELPAGTASARRATAELVVTSLEASYIWITVLSNALQYRESLLGWLQDIFVPKLNPYVLKRRTDFQLPLNNAPQQSLLVPALCSTWLCSACNIASGPAANAVRDALLAVGLAATASTTPDIALQRTMAQEALSLYSQVLGRLRAWSSRNHPYQGNDPEWTIIVLTCFCCFSYELVANKSYPNARLHLNGVGIMLQQAGPEGLTSELARDIYFEYRALNIAWQMFSTQSSFLSEEAWIYPTWKSQHPKASHPLQSLLDYAYRIPPLVDRVNQLCAASISNLSPDDFGELRQLFTHTLNIKDRIEAWKLRLESENGLDQKDASQRLRQATFPTWDNRDADPEEDDSGRVFPVAYTFSDFSIATGLVFFEAIQICLSGFLANMSAHLRSLTENNTAQPNSISLSPQLNQEVLDRASCICQSAEYFLAPDKKLVGPMILLFPLAVATSTFINGGIPTTRHDTLKGKDSNETARKLSWCRMIEEKLRATGLPPFPL